MTRTILITTAAIAAAFVQPVQAGPHGGGGGGGGHGGGGGGGGARFSGGGGGHAAFHGGGGGGAAFRGGGSTAFRGGGGGAVHFQSAPRMAGGATSMPRAATQSQSFALRNSTGSGRTFSQASPRAAITNRSFNGTNRQAQTFAFGGTAPANRNFEGRAADTRSFSRPSAEASRNWDRRQIHTWNNHRYRWFNNNWVILDGGWGYGSPYYYGGYSPYYYGDDYDYDTPAESAGAAPNEYSSSANLAASVQEELVQKGYNPGAVDGVIGPQTRNAIGQFQSDHRLPVTGDLNPATISAMGLR